MQSSQQRKHIRGQVIWMARVAWKGHGVVEGRILNISVGGAYLETRAELAIKSEFVIQVHATVKQKMVPLLIKSRVCRRTVLSGLRGYGYGLEFTSIKETDRQLIQLVIENT